MLVRLSVSAIFLLVNVNKRGAEVGDDVLDGDEVACGYGLSGFSWVSFYFTDSSQNFWFPLIGKLARTFGQQSPLDKCA